MSSKLLLLFIVLSSNAFAYTLNNNFGSAFKSNKVTVSVDEATTCAQAGVTAEELKDFIAPAIDRFWNKVPTSSLRLKDGGFSQAITNMNNGYLCAPTDEDCVTTAGTDVIAPVKNIIIACNDRGINFGGTSVLAVTIPNNFSGKKITGSVILINNMANSSFADLSKSDRIGVIAHEIGHAIGLGHTDDKAALMYYRTVKQRRTLGEDDMLGVSYLYPMHGDGAGLLNNGLLGSCGTISSGGDQPPTNPPFLQMVSSLALMILLFECRKLFNRTKTRSAT